MESVLKKEVIINKDISRAIALAAFVLLTALGAFVRLPLPFTPVPLTLQTFFVLLAAAMLGRNLGFLSQSLYVLLGLGGVPIFANAGYGPAYLFGPTGGYILGFLLASFFIGQAIRSKKETSFLFVFLVMFGGTLIILLSGGLWLKILFNYHPKKVFLIGVLPFLPGDLIKTFFACVLFLKLRARLKEIL